MSDKEPEKIVAYLTQDEEGYATYGKYGDKGWVLDLGKWEPSDGMKEGDWVEITIRRCEFQP